MKYIKLGLQEKEKFGQVIAGINYIEYDNKLSSAAVFTALNFDTIYIPMSQNDYNNLLKILLNKDTIEINIAGYTQPFESYEDKKGNYKQMDEEIRRKAIDRNKGKTIKFE